MPWIVDYVRLIVSLLVIIVESLALRQVLKKKFRRGRWLVVFGGVIWNYFCRFEILFVRFTCWVEITLILFLWCFASLFL